MRISRISGFNTKNMSFSGGQCEDFLSSIWCKYLMTNSLQMLEALKSPPAQALTLPRWNSPKTSVKKTVVKIGPLAYDFALDRHSGLSKTEYGAGQGSLHVCLKNGKT